LSTTLTLTGLGVAYGARTLVTGLDLVVADGDVTALVGPNGSGKSSLMRTLVGELPVESGSVRLAPDDATIGWLPQVTPDPDESLLAYARRRTGVAEADRALHAASEALAEHEPDADHEYADALERWLHLGAADLEDRLPQVAAQVGLDVAPERPLGTLSGGQTARAALVAVLLSRYDVLLLDEPTNNLDSRGLALMADFVASHDGPVLVASHDRAFLDLVTTSVVELDLPQQRIGHYTGNYSDFTALREIDRRHAREAFEEYAGARDPQVAPARQRADWAAKGHRDLARGTEPDKHLRERVRARADRQGAKSARLRKAVDRLDVVDQPRKEWELRYSIKAGPPSADVVATLQRAEVVRGEFRLGPVDLTVARGDRIALSGDNGSGKSTLLGALLDELPLDAGQRTLGTRVRVGVIDQQRALLETDDPLVDVVRRELGDPDRGEVRTLLAKFGLGAEHVDRPSRSLSMGERTRALMALFQARQVNVLVLDEPTNHLDVPAIEQLESALADYEGTLVVVTHDQRFLEEIGVTRRIHVDLGQVTEE
jgi:ATPase subunit of ABC transporter with duplicated ATPase domains